MSCIQVLPASTGARNHDAGRGTSSPDEPFGITQLGRGWGMDQSVAPACLPPENVSSGGSASMPRRSCCAVRVGEK